MARNYLALPFEYLDEMELLTDAEFGRLVRGLLRYSRDGEEIEAEGNEKFYAVRVIEREKRFKKAFDEEDRRKKERAEKAAQARWEREQNEKGQNNDSLTPVQDAQACSSMHKHAQACTSMLKDAQACKPNPNPNPNPKPNPKPNNNIDIGGDKRPSAPKPERHKYGLYDNVLLSDAELDKLKAEFPADYQERIERVSEYVAAKGVSYKNFLAVIRSWAKKDTEADNERRDNTAKIKGNEGELKKLWGQMPKLD